MQSTNDQAMTTRTATTHAVVLGASMAGLLTARVLSEHVGHVTIVERDLVADGPVSRKGQPQTRHLHGLLSSGLAILSGYFPDLRTTTTPGPMTRGRRAATRRDSLLAREAGVWQVSERASGAFNGPALRRPMSGAATWRARSSPQSVRQRRRSAASPTRARSAIRWSS